MINSANVLTVKISVFNLQKNMFAVYLLVMLFF